VGALHDEIRVFPGLFKRSIETYKALRDVEKHYKNFSVQVETTVSKHNEDVLLENYEWFRKNLDVDTVFTLLTRGSPKEPLAKFFDVEKYQAYADHMEKEYKSGSLSGYDHFPFADFINAKRIVRHNMIARIARDNEYQIPCYAGNLGGALFANGDVYPCELLIDRKLGNVREAGYDFKKIWFSREAEQARKFIRESKCFCTYECFLTINILFNPMMMPAVLKEWSSLKMRKLWRRLTGKQPQSATLATCGSKAPAADAA
jgi:radical SAM protein with 4Fe4S-binding SPASM domain